MYDTSIGYPPGLTRERFISFARNTINRGILQKHYSPRKGRNSTIHQTFGHSVSSTSKTEIPRNSVKHYSPIPWIYFSTTRKIIRQLRITFFSQPKHYLGEKPRKRENRLPNWSDRFDISEISDFLSTPPPLFIGILRRFAKDRNALGLHKITYMPLSG